jgi:hypothetical protein
MSDKPLLKRMDGLFAVCRKDTNMPPPAWAFAGGFYCIAKTPDELSIVCAQELVPPDVVCETGWRVIGMQGPLDFSLTGVLAPLATILAQNGISIFAVSTFDTDYILVKQDHIEKAIASLTSAGYRFV